MTPSPLQGIDPDLLLGLNLLGTFAFGLSGGMAGVRARLDLFGTVVLAAVVGMAGGIIRDLLIGTPPATFRDWRYLAVVAAAGVVTIVGHRVIDRLERPITALDAGGLALFSVTGAATALEFGLGPASAVLLGAITAIGGGMVRDLLVREIPTVLQGGLYAVPALLGASIVVIADRAGGESVAFPWLAVVACLALRLLAVRNDWGLPVAEEIGGRSLRPRGEAAERR